MVAVIETKILEKEATLMLRKARRKLGGILSARDLTAPRMS